MSKRILAMILSLLLVLSACFLAACGGEDGEASISESQADEEGSANESGGENSEDDGVIDLEKDSAMVIFKGSLENLTMEFVPDDVAGSIYPGNDTDLTGALKLEVNKLSIQGEDLLGGNPIKATFDASYDKDNAATDIDIGLDVLGEKPTLSAVYNVVDTGYNVYFTDLLGIDEDVLFTHLPQEEFDEYMNLINSQSQFSQEELEALEEGLEQVVETIKKALADNVPEEAFAKEIKTVTVDGVEFENACIVSLDLTTEILKALSEDVVGGILSNEAIAAILSQNGVDVDEIKDEFLNDLKDDKDIPALKFINTLDKDGNIISFDVVMSMDAEDQGSIKLDIDTVNGNFKLKAGVFDGESFANDYFYIEYLYNTSVLSESFAIGMFDNEQRNDMLSIQGTNDGNKRVGTLSVNVEETKVSFKYDLESTAETLNLKITDLSIPVEGMSVTLPIEINFYNTVNDKEITSGLTIKANVAGFADIDIVAEYSVRTDADVTIEIPTEYVDFDKITEEEMLARVDKWAAAAQTKYPNILNAIKAFIASNVPDDAYGDMMY